METTGGFMLRSWRNSIVALSMVLGFLRAGLGLAIMSWPEANAVAVMFGAFEAVSGTVGIANAVVCRGIDLRPLGFLLPAIHVLGAVCVPSPVSSPTFLIAGMSVVWAVRVWALGAMGIAYSVGPASWVSLADRGPFAFVRHPMASSGVLARLVFVAGNPEPWNLFVLVVMGVAEIVSVLIEEGFLLRRAEYRSYARRVRWRLLPGVY